MNFSTGALAIFLAAYFAPSSGFSHSPVAFGVKSSHRISAHHDVGRHSRKLVAKRPRSVLHVANPIISEEELARVTDASASVDAARASTAEYLSKYMGKTGATIIYDKLVEHGVDVVNGYSGGAVLPLLDQFHEDHPRHEGLDVPPIRWITNSNENSAGHIAEGYAKASPVLKDGLRPAGVVVATSGPGVTNLITPLQDAICDGVPMVVLCGQAATTAPPDAFQQAPAVDLTRPCTKWSYQIQSAAELPFVLDYAFYIARHGRPGPVFVDLPKDLQVQLLDAELLESFTASIPVRGEEFRGGAIRFAPRDTNVEDGEKKGVREHVLHVGDPDRGILFSSGEEGRLSPVTDLDLGGQQGVYQRDHHVSDMVYHMEVGENARKGSLDAASDMALDVFDMIRHAKKPFIIAGQGCNSCPEELAKFAENMEIPVATTLHGLGCFDERHNLALNMLGMHGHPTPNYMIQEADTVICIGSRFDDRITGRAPDFIPKAKEAAAEGRGGVVHVDVRLSENCKQVPSTFFVHSTGAKFLQTMNSIYATRRETNVAKATTADRTPWLRHMRDLQRDFPVKVPTFPPQLVKGKDGDGHDTSILRTPMSAQCVVSELNRQLLAADRMDDCLFSTGVGIHQMVAAQLLTWTQPRQMVTSGSLGTMGVALGFVIGCHLANGKKICIAVDGDGSFNMTFTELKTVAEQKIPVKIMILDNESQMMVEYWQRLFHNERYLAVTNTVNPDYCKLADAFDIKNLHVDCEEDLEDTMHKFLFEDPGEPVLMHVRIQRTPCLPLVAPGKPLDEMILEDTTCEGLDPCAAPS
mmetsp:Transcript_31382/g.71795  ORF Transcript_31382/g.71795 Transcript_31382/m.71795 type:complete len:810 (-) Transcript_31382:484-2913(-)|eukprot:CAMPEP_0113310640 /NCGR_PEP_ID=MMETSP0010_2-20120614/8204_1 /TAXON_ID=216773 ORGANISM="Corethron hystrix, Strain 308" /NCGR_SAMPLE_ID=MMETSP0010_2 /ASSEMBLY_ACC=CAM_ASM_000155 /LENGTH=809 /DNA_ID=CAMNT_0000166135 /DNA_START=608 /DNA_END=3037 /DNA_ORIENTATION=+ /assembly_acc=CAM_ASM_000155